MYPIINFQLPTYSSSAKFMIVEDFALVHHPTLLHFGRCSVIGKVVLGDDQLFRLKSLKIDFLPQEYQLPDETLEILLSFQNCPSSPIKNTYIEVIGESMLLNMTEWQNQHSLPITTSMDLIRSLGKLQMSLENGHNIQRPAPTGMADRTMKQEVRNELRKRLDIMKAQLSPIIVVTVYRQVLQPKSLIKCNLKLRSVWKKRIL